MIDVTSCPVCRSTQVKSIADHLFSYPEDCPDPPTPNTHYEKERLWIFFNYIARSKEPQRVKARLCDTCGFIFTSPRLTSEEIELKYRTVDSLQSAKIRAEKNPPMRIEKRSERIRRVVEKSLDRILKGGNILDYGGAEGYNLISFAGENNCFVLDWVKMETPSGIQYLGKTLDDLPKDQKFDLILLSHVLEHAESPVGLLKDLAARLSKGGVIYVEVPLGAFREWMRLKEPLTHINFFSEESLFKCMREAGLVPIWLRTGFVWVTHGRNWCVMAVGKKEGDGEGKPYVRNRFRSTEEQMDSLFLETIFAIGKVWEKTAAKASHK